MRALTQADRGVRSFCGFNFWVSGVGVARLCGDTIPSSSDCAMQISACDVSNQYTLVPHSL